MFAKCYCELDNGVVHAAEIAGSSTSRDPELILKWFHVFLKMIVPDALFLWYIRGFLVNRKSAVVKVVWTCMLYIYIVYSVYYTIIFVLF